MKSLSDLLQRVAATIEHHRMFAPGHRVGVAVSGGADSVCLLHALCELAPRWNLSLAVLHLNHNLRGEESKADADFVYRLATQLGLRFIFRDADLTASGNLEQAAREARLAFFRDIIGSCGADRIALGHTRRDQAETVLFRFLRGAGTAGLAGIRPVTSDGIVRPLIETGRDEIESWLRARALPWREDSTNSSPAFARNRIRHELLPQLARDWNPQIEQTLAQTAAWAQAEESYWQSELAHLNPGPILEAAALRTLPEAAARRLIRAAIAQAKGDLRAIDFSHIDAILTLAHSPKGHGAVDIPALTVQRSFDQIRLAPPQPEPAPYSFPVHLPNPAGPIAIRQIENPEASTLCDCLDGDRLPGPLFFRSWNPGDRFQPIGAAAPRKLKALFHAARIPLWDRTGWPVLVHDSTVVWTRRFGVAAAVAPDASTRTILRIQEIPPA